MGIAFDQKTLDKIHSVQLEMLIEFDRICRKYGIKYVISGGTLLGAVRNGGFIQWDDDIDIRMERKEYLRFTKVYAQELDTKRFFFQNHETDAGYPWYYGKLRYIHSKYIREGQEHLKMQNGIFIDIMPADGLPNNPVIRNITISVCFLLKKFLYSAVGCVSENNIIKRAGYKVMNVVPKKWIFATLDWIAEKYMDEKYPYVTSYSFVKCGQKNFIQRSWHTDCIELLFENQYFLAPRQYHQWLSMTYGKDYMLPPPIGERRGHNTILEYDLEER